MYFFFENRSFWDCSNNRRNTWSGLQSHLRCSENRFESVVGTLEMAYRKRVVGTFGVAFKESSNVPTTWKWLTKTVVGTLEMAYNAKRKTGKNITMLDFFFLRASKFVSYGSRFFGRGWTLSIKEIYISSFILNNFRCTWPPMCEKMIDLLLENCPLFLNVGFWARLPLSQCWSFCAMSSIRVPEPPAKINIEREGSGAAEKLCQFSNKKTRQNRWTNDFWTQNTPKNILFLTRPV